MIIKILEVGEVVKKNKYFELPLKYEDKGKEFDRKILSFTDVYDVFKSAKPGEVYQVDIKKDDNGYWQWVKATLNGADSGGSSATSGGSQSKFIIRQNSVTNAVNFVNGKHDDEVVNIDTVLAVAAQFEEWVNR